MINFVVKKRAVFLEYRPEFTSENWIWSELNSHQKVTISRGFHFLLSDLSSAPPKNNDKTRDDYVFRFKFAIKENGYFRINGRKLGLDIDVLIADEGVKLERNIFIAERNIGIFRRIAKMKKNATDIVVGGNSEGNIPIDVFYQLLDKFPNSGELDRYASARVETIVGEFFDEMKSARDNYEAYLTKRKSIVSHKPLQQSDILQAEIDKFVYVQDTISAWLKKSEIYSERDWQRMIIKVILLIFPKYVAVLENIEISDFYTTPGEIKKRFIDVCLVDASGNIDVIEIKKPFENAILRKALYRDNSIPARELSGSIMQAEKYLFHLSKWGVNGERVLSKRYADKLPTGMKIRVTNPKAMILLGRDHQSGGSDALSDNQMFDLEVIKRKYSNIMDILTYDDLLRRLSRIISSLSQRLDASS